MGKYYITETHHTFSEHVYKTAFSVRGLRGGDLLSLLSPPTQLHPGQTLLISKVTNIEDPVGLGRGRVQFPTLTEDHESQWARVVAIGAGKGRGFDCLPEEVLVGFEHGDIHRPFIIGGLWNGSDSLEMRLGVAKCDCERSKLGLDINYNLLKNRKVAVRLASQSKRQVVMR